jgi:hypothetical protein
MIGMGLDGMKGNEMHESGDGVGKIGTDCMDTGMGMGMGRDGPLVLALERWRSVSPQ